MSKANRAVLGCLGVANLALVVMSSLVVLNWDSVARNASEALEAQSERSATTLFRWGELMSMSVRLKEEYGTEPHMAYETDTGDRILSITFSNYRLPESATAEGHARELAAFAVGETKKFEKIDVVKVVFQDSTEKGGNEADSNPEPYSFTLGELMPVQP